ncbi:hypothetical protein BHE97_04695 [Aeromicrobium sp. PE09-221]|uniref:extracellular solute-binding protein n=1 Tax=Aeromicrobium sp. PE09-221 TaxID=1898043 RepID=UPI000B3ED6B5|nr:extracellular solute-binding protein [Aeromicrobium sp. PE09-221]OUZ11156.1 hypothetical protein BHE97_04695 [Aeromicrobium sp. PE09-221]
MKQKKLIQATALVSCIALLTAACGGSDDAGGDQSSGGSDLSGEQFVFVNWGGSSMQAAEQGWLEPFAEQTGVKWTTDSPTDNAKIKAMVEGGKVTWDVVDNDVAVGASNCGTLFEKRPADIDMSDIDPQYVTDDCGVPIMIQAVGLMYNKELFGDDPPTAITDFMDTERFPGKRVLWNYPTSTAEPLLAADGVATEDIYPIDWTRVENAMGSLGGDLVLQDTLSQVGETIQTGDYAMSLFYFGRAAVLPEAARENIGIVWDTTYFAWDAAYMVKDSQNTEAASEFLRFLATKDGQAGFSKHAAYGPATVGGLQESGIEVPEAFEPWMPDFNEDKIRERINYDVDYWTENVDEALQEWTRITSG